MKEEVLGRWKDGGEKWGFVCFVFNSFSFGKDPMGVMGRYGGDREISGIRMHNVEFFGNKNFPKNQF